MKEAIMYPERDSVERLELDREQDQALLAARGRQAPEPLEADEPQVSEESEEIGQGETE